jgi:hypothetical protein
MMNGTISSSYHELGHSLAVPPSFTDTARQCIRDMQDEAARGGIAASVDAVALTRFTFREACPRRSMV